MYEIKDFEDGGALLDYLNALGNHEVIFIQHDKTWTVLVRISKMGRPKKEEPKEEIVVTNSVPRPEVTPPTIPLGFPQRYE